jgi:replication factor C large subunit
MVWTEKYRPKTLTEVIGNEAAKYEMVRWIKEWEKGIRKYPGLFLVGPPGIGKTTSVHALAKDLGYHVVELNASEYRTAERIYERLGSLTSSYTLESYLVGGRRKRVLVFFDEIDGIDPKEDKGGLDAVVAIAEKREFPVIAAANVPDRQKHKKLFELFKVIEFRELTPRQIIILLKRIIGLEKLNIKDNLLIQIAERSRGDARLAVNMLQAAIAGVAIESISQPLENLPFDELLRRLSSTISYYEIKLLIDSNSSLWNDVIYTYFDIISRSPMIKLEDKIALLDELSRIDIYLGRISKERKYFYLRYLSHLISWLIYKANRSGALYDGRIPEYRFYRFILNRGVAEELSAIVDELKGRIHESVRKFTIHTLPVYCLIYDNKKGKLCKWVEKAFGRGRVV